jgi:hypothetical protein
MLAVISFYSWTSPRFCSSIVTPIAVHFIERRLTIRWCKSSESHAAMRLLDADAKHSFCFYPAMDHDNLFDKTHQSTEFQAARTSRRNRVPKEARSLCQHSNPVNIDRFQEEVLTHSDRHWPVLTMELSRFYHGRRPAITGTRMLNLVHPQWGFTPRQTLQAVSLRNHALTQDGTRSFHDDNFGELMSPCKLGV